MLSAEILALYRLDVAIAARFAHAPTVAPTTIQTVSINALDPNA